MEGRRPSSSTSGAEGPVARRGPVIVVDDDALFREGLALLLTRSGFELLAGGDRVGYLLNGRVIDVPELIDALERILRGGSVIDPILVRE